MGAVVTVEGVTRRFEPPSTWRSRPRAEIDALVDVSITVSEAETVTLLGPSGCGKTTLLRLIAGLDDPTGGAIRIDGRTPDEARRAKTIAVMPQSPALLPWRTVEANARLLVEIGPPGGDRDLADELIDLVGLSDFRSAFPHELSGGMQQRVALVRSFALDAPLLLMDEPFAALDEITRAEMRHVLARLRDRTHATIVFVTHSVAEAAYLSDRVVVMTPRPGRVADTLAIELPRPRPDDVEATTAFFETTRLLSATIRDASDSDRTSS